MRIKELRASALSYPEPNDFGNQRFTVLARVEAEDGTTGWGEGIAMWPEACRATVALIEHGFRELVVGQDALSPAPIWRKLKDRTWWYGEGGIASFAISSIDMALWDLRGKVLGQPLYEMLGGAVKESLPANASAHVNKATMEEMVAEVVSFKEAGFPSVKLGFGKRGLSKIGKDPRYDVEFIKEVRRAVGPDMAIMVDIGNGVRWDAPTAIRTTRQFEEQDIDWIEEPLPPTDLAGYRRLRDAVQTAIGSGEREFTDTGYQRLIASDTIDVFGVDPARVEGITGFIKVMRLIEAAQRTVNAHAWSTAIATAASLHLSVCTPCSRWLELKPFPNPMQHELVNEPIWHEKGMVKPPKRPGLGIEIREEVVQKYAI